MKTLIPQSVVVLLGLLTLGLVSCTTMSSASSSPTAAKDITGETAKLLAQKQYTFVAERVNSRLPGMQIFTINHYCWMNVQGDKIEMRLPYLGYQYTGPDYSRESPLDFDGTILSYTATGSPNDRRGTTIKMKVKSGRTSQNYEVSLQVQNDRSARLIVTSMNRSDMEFWGTLNTLDEEQ